MKKTIFVLLWFAAVFNSAFAAGLLLGLSIEKGPAWLSFFITPLALACGWFAGNMCKAYLKSQ